jgi:hypothetical protein
MPYLSYLYQGIIVPASVTIPLAAGMAKYRYLEKSLKVIVLYLTVAGVVNAIAALLAFHHVRNLPLLHIYTILELICLGVFFYFIFDSKVMGRWLLAVTFIISVFCIVNFLFLQSIYSFNSYTRPLEAIVLIAFAAFYFFIQASRNTVSRWTDQPENWMVTGIVFYFSSALAQFSFSNVVSATTSFDTKMVIWNIHATLVLLMYLLFTVGFLKCKK